MLSRNMMGGWSLLVRKTHLSKARLLSVAGKFDPWDWLGLPLDNGQNRPVVYIPVPKVANTSIRTALLATIGVAAAAVRNVHNDPRLPKESLKKLAESLPPDSYFFTVVRHPAARIRSAYRNKLVDQKKSFGPARRLGVFKTDSFEQFLEKCADIPAEYLDAHFKPQSQLLHYATQKRDVQVFKMETLTQDWPLIRDAIAQRGLNLPPAELAQLNVSTKVKKPVYSMRERHLISQIFETDFNQFDYSW